MSRQRVTFGCLVIGHLLCSPRWFADLHVPFGIWGVLFLGLLFGQSTLLAVWFALAKGQWPAKAAVAATFWLVLVIPNDRAPHDTPLVLMVAAGVMICLWGLLKAIQSRSGIYLCQSNSAPTPGNQGLQFSIKQLMALTMVVAVVFGLRRSISEIGQTEAIITVVGLCMLVMPLTAIWSCLSAGRPLVPCLLVLVLALLIGAIPPIYFDRYRTAKVVSFWPAVILLQAAVCIFSLLVVRSLGYRLVRRSAIEPATEPEGVGAESSPTSSSV